MKTIEGPFNKIGKDNYLKIVYFDLHVLEKYFNNPQYFVCYSDYRGSISLNDKYSNEINKGEEIKNFGIAYYRENLEKRVLVAFANDLSKLSLKNQSYWYSFYLENQDNYLPNEGFIKNLIYGEWVEDISIYEALLMEIHYINVMCDNMKIPKMFKKEFSYDTLDKNDRPVNFHIILLPTIENYYNFINILEKIVINNINHRTFLKKSRYISDINRKKENGETKGTLMLLNEWLLKNDKSQSVNQYVMEPLRNLRKMRQAPAHKIYENEYDEKIWSKQTQLMEETYTAIRSIRLFFSMHPMNKNMKIEKVLYEGRQIISY